MRIWVIARKKFKFKGREFARVFFDKKIIKSRLIFNNKEKILEIKTPEKEKINQRQAVLIARQIIVLAKKYGVKKIALDWRKIKDFGFKNKKDIAKVLAVNFEMANYEFIKYKKVPRGGWNFVEEVVFITEDGESADLTREIKRGQLTGKHVNKARELSNTPGGEMTPELLAGEIKKSAKNTKVKVKILEEADMRKLSMGAVLGVARGSMEKPKFIILEYAGKREKNPIVLIGKGVTFDSGGLNLKPDDNMNEMHRDMSGGAAVAFAVILAAKMGIKKRIVGLIPAVENMPSGESLRPNDILKSMSGKTIEVQNTDAEGRVILADALTYAERYNPRLVIDVATLTGASLITLGEKASVIISKDEKLIENVKKLGEESGDYVWPLPLWEEYEKEVKGVFADVCNLRNQGNTKYAGSILGGAFLYEFAKKFPKWLHIDMGSRDHASYDEFLSKGAAGAPVRLLIKLLEEY